jgi:hypothetical protein
MAFEPWLREIPGQRSCRTCRAVAERFPPVIPPDPSNDLARARHLLGRLRAVTAGRCTPTQMRRAVGEVLAAVDTVLPNPPVPRVPWPGITPVSPIEPQRLLVRAGAPARPG